MDSDHEGRRYRILDVLGKGGFGTVYRAEMSSPGGFVKEVALKVVPGNLDGTGEKIARLRDEARLLGALRHRSIVGVDALTRLGERWAIVMEYVPGVTVRDLLDHHGQLPLVVGLQVAIEIASALHAAWEAQVPARTLDARRVAGGDAAATEPLRLIHRDVKPSNIQLTRHGDVKLLDFGIARSSAEGNLPGNVVYGSIPYLAPERLEGKDTHEGDVYSLALTLVQMLSGTVPRPGAPAAERIAHTRELLATTGASDALVDAAVSALDPDPAKRPDARAFGLSLRRVLKNFTVFDPRDWAEENVGPLLEQSQPHAGDLTGMSFADGAAAATELFTFGKASATFDDPMEVGFTPIPAPPRASPSAVPSVVSQDATTSGLVIPELPTSPPPEPPKPALQTMPTLSEESAGPPWGWILVAALCVVAVGLFATVMVAGAATALGALAGFLVAISN